MRRFFYGLVDIGAGDATVAARARYQLGIDIVLDDRALHGGGQAHFGITDLVRPERSRGAFLENRCRRPSISLGTNGLLCFLRRDATKYSAGQSLGVRFKHDLLEHARRGSGHFDRDLVGLQLDERIVYLDPIPDGLQPGADDRLGAFLFPGNNDVDHDEILLVNPAKAGVPWRPAATSCPEIPAFAGMTVAIIRIPPVLRSWRGCARRSARPN